MPGADRTSRMPDVVCISSIDWDFIWQGHQEIMSTLAAEGQRVLFIENTGVRAPSMRDFPRLRQRIRNWWRSTKGFREEGPNLFIYSPLVLPLPYSRVARWMNRVLMMRALHRWMRATGLYRPIVWTFLPTPLALDLIHALDPQLIVYYCIDDLASSSPAAKRIVPSEQRLFREADLVFVTSEKLRQRAAILSERVHLFPFGVSLQRFERVLHSEEPVPADLQALKRPIVGYVGGLHQWVDLTLIASLAAQMPNVTIALVGPAQVDVSSLGQYPNVHLFGQRPHPEVPQYIKGFDVGIVPYLLTDYTANVYPTKLNEYLAMGVPVVATDLPEINRFNADHGQIVAVAADADAFAAAIRSALAGSSPAETARRIAVAQENSWQRRIASMKGLIAAALDRRAASQQRWDETLRRVYRETRTHIAQVAAALAVMYLLVFYTNLIWWAAAPLKIASTPAPADAIVVFAGGVGESGKAGGGAQERVEQAVELYNAGLSRHLVLSSGYVYSFREVEVMRTVAIDQGVAAADIVLEQQSTNTHENVTFVREILRAQGWKSALLVSSPYHMRRALLVWHKEAPEVSIIPAPPPRSQFYDHTRGASLEQVAGILHEYAAILGYWRRGWI